MSQKLLQELAKCSKNCKSSLGLFINGLKEKDKTESNALMKNQLHLEAIFNQNTLQFTMTKAREISKGQRSEKLLIDHQYNYGEITFSSIYLIFQKIKAIRHLKQTEIFYDLGSGIGKVVFAAALCYPFSKCIGIEYLQSLYDTSQKLKQKLNEQKQTITQQIQELDPIVEAYELPVIQFINQDFKKVNWSNGSIIFVSSTCYSRDVMNQIGNLCSNLQKDTVVITMTRKLQNCAEMKLVDSFVGQTSWGESNIFIHVKQS